MHIEKILREAEAEADRIRRELPPDPFVELRGEYRCGLHLEMHRQALRQAVQDSITCDMIEQAEQARERNGR